jgi:hypothetical protein
VTTRGAGLGVLRRYNRGEDHVPPTPKTTFTTTLLQSTDIDATGIVVPPDIVAALGTSKRPAVTVTLNGYSYRSTVTVMSGRFMLPLAKVHREAAGVVGGQKVTVTLALDTAPRTVDVPADLKSALTKGKVLKAFEASSYTNRKEWVRGVEDAKAAETRARRIAKVVAALQD